MADDELAAERGKGEHKPSKGFHWFAYVFVPVAVAILSAVVTFWLTQYGGRLRTFKYGVASSSAIFQKPEMGQEIKVTVGNKAVDNISTATVLLFNTTDQDFDDVPVTVTLKSKVGGKPNVLYARSATPSTPSPEPQTQPLNPAEVVYSFKVRVANRSEKPVFTAEYFVEGKEAPDVTLSVEKKGLTVERTELAAVSNKSTDWRTVFLFAAVGAGTFLLKNYVDALLQAKKEPEKQKLVKHVILELPPKDAGEPSSS